jgi:hypothetical protein
LQLDAEAMKPVVKSRHRGRDIRLSRYRRSGVKLCDEHSVSAQSETSWRR